MYWPPIKNSHRMPIIKKVWFTKKKFENKWLQTKNKWLKTQHKTHIFNIKYLKNVLLERKITFLPNELFWSLGLREPVLDKSQAKEVWCFISNQINKAISFSPILFYPSSTIKVKHFFMVREKNKTTETHKFFFVYLLKK